MSRKVKHIMSIDHCSGVSKENFEELENWIETASSNEKQSLISGFCI